MRPVLAVVVLALFVAPSASAKFGVALSLATDRPGVRDAVRVVVRLDGSPGRGCGMRLLAVAPGVNTFRALDAFVSGGYSVNGPQGPSFHTIRPTPRMGFVLDMTRVRPRTWRVTIRFPSAGPWRLIVPNWCSPGYVYPLPVDRLVTVR